MKFSEEELIEFLNFKAEHYENPKFIESDPIQIAHQFSKKEDIEIIAFIIATIAWGNRKSIISNGQKLVEIMESAPHEFLMDFNSKSLKNSHFVHRTFNKMDLDFFLQQLKHIYSEGGLEIYFDEKENSLCMKDRIVRFRNGFLRDTPEHRSSKHISNPDKNSAAKRLNMFLRWMVRDAKNGVDFGLWKNVSTKSLMIPLDVHTGTVARKLGLLQRTQNDWKALEELMTKLRSFDANDPVKYDFALFGLGAFEKF